MIFGRRRRLSRLPPPPEPPPVSPVPLAPGRAIRQEELREGPPVDVTIDEFLRYVRSLGPDANSLTLEDALMGMYEQVPNFEESFKDGDQFAVTAMRYVGTINTRVGNAEKVEITLTTRETYPETQTYSALGVGFAAQAQRATADDFPHVAQFVRARTPGGNQVKRLQPVIGEDNEPVSGGERCRAWIEKKLKTLPVVVEHADAAGPSGASTPAPGNRAGF